MRVSRRPQVIAAAAVPLLIAGLSVGGAGTSPAATTGFSFTNFEPAGLKTFGLEEGGGRVGSRCPGAGPSVCYNVAGEPAIRADAAGNFYAASENGLGAGTEAWKSTDGGRHYVTLPSPDAGATGNDSGVEPGGGDVDVAVGDDPNASGFYPLHISSLNLANVDVSNSQDGGA